MSRVTGTALPAGLTDGERATPDVTRLQLEAGDTVVLVSDGVADGREDQWLRDALAALPADQREAVRRRYWLEQTTEQIAAATGQTEKEVRKLEAKALRTLRHPSVSRALR